MGLMLVVVALGTLYGWRYGFSPLPKPVPGFEFRPESGLAVEALTPAHAWFWCRKAAAAEPARSSPRASAPRSNAPMAPLALEAWTQTGVISPKARSELVSWLDRHPQLESCFRSALAAPKRGTLASADLEALLGARMLLEYPSCRAAVASGEGRMADALGDLVDAWRLLVLLDVQVGVPNLFDARANAELDAVLVGPWCRLVLHPDPIPPDVAPSLLTALGQVDRDMITVETMYRRRASDPSLSCVSLREAAWGRVRLSLRTASLRIRQDLSRFTAVVVGRVTGGRLDMGDGLRGVGHFGRPVVLVWCACQEAVARENDLKQAREAWLSWALAGLKQPLARPGEAAGVNPWCVSTNSWWHRNVDRPAARRIGRSLPSPDAVRAELAGWKGRLGLCRMMLATRMFRDQQGQWPTQPSELAPFFPGGIPDVPWSGLMERGVVDPATAQP